MPDIFALISEYVEFFPLIAFLGLVLSGMSLPVSEDLIIITGALLSHEEPGLLIYNLLAVYLGAAATDYFAYFVGSKVRSGAAKASFFTRVIPDKALEKIGHYMDKYGIFTFIVGRFIPFGFRNAMFFTAGFSRLRFRVFVIYEAIAVTISVNTLFFLAYHFGEVIKKPVKIAGIILLILAVTGIITLIVRLIVAWRKKKSSPLES